jgi:hypothetical protein
MSLEATENSQPDAVPPAEGSPPAAAGEAPADSAEPEPAQPPADSGAAGAAEAPEAPEAAAIGGDDGAEPPAGGGQPAEFPQDIGQAELVGAAEPVEWAEPGPRRHGFALAALFVVAALVIVGGAVVTVGALTHGFHKPVKVTYRESAVFKLQTGDCVNTPNAQVVSVLPCSTPHQAEVFATFALPASAWPGTDTVRTEASTGCAARLTGYLNPQLAISLAQSYVFPDQVAWTAGTRTVICEVQATSGQLTGSVRGAS